MTLRYQPISTNEDFTAIWGISSQPSNPEFHLHNNYEVYLFLNGRVNYFVEQSCYTLGRGSLLIFNSNEIHKTTNISGKPYERITLHFSPEFVQPHCTSRTDLLACFQNHEPGADNIRLLSEEQTRRLEYLCGQLIQELGRDHYGQDILSLAYLQQILVFVNDRFLQSAPLDSPGRQPEINAVMQYIDSHLADELTLTKLADVRAQDKYYLSHQFKKATGSSIYQYILLKRIALARQLLSAGKNVTETCSLSGFHDYANFIRTFKKVTGMSPGQFKKKMVSC